MTNDVATVAARLTKAQAARLRVGAWNVKAHVQGFIDAGLVKRGHSYSIELTPLGLSVRDHILKEQKGC